MPSHVFVEIVRVVETSSTNLTVVTKISRVYLHVPIQSRLAGDLFVAFSTREGIVVAC